MALFLADPGPWLSHCGSGHLCASSEFTMMRGCAGQAPGGPLSLCPGGRGLETRAAHIIGGSVSFAHLHSEAASPCAPLYLHQIYVNIY